MDTELKKLTIDKGMKARRDKSGSSLPWIVVVVVLLLAGGALAWQKWGSARAVEVEVTRVRLPEGAVAESDLVKLSATGYIIAAAKIEVASKVVGRVAWVGVERGDKVAKDQVVVKLEDEEYQARLIQQQGMLESAQARLAELEAGSRAEELAQAQANLDVARVEFENAEISFKRLEELMPTRSVSRQDLDDAAALVRSRRARVESVRQSFELIKAGPRKEEIAAQRAVVKQMEGGLKMVQIEVDNTIIRAPVAGTILARNVEVGEFVTTGFVGDNGAKGFVVSLADLNDLRVELDVSQNDFARTKLNQPCWITTDAYPDRKYMGYVDLVSPEANRQKATVQVRVKISAPDDLLRPEMNATVSFLDAEKLAAAGGGTSATPMPAAERPMLKIPASAVKDGAVFVVEGGKAVSRVVAVGKSEGGQVEVRKGLIGGEDLITAPPGSLKSGDAVKMK